MPIIRCPQCSEKMQVDRGDLGERVVCPGCDHRFAAREDAPDDDRPSDRGGCSRIFVFSQVGGPWWRFGLFTIVTSTQAI